MKTTAANTAANTAENTTVKRGLKSVTLEELNSARKEVGIRRTNLAFRLLQLEAMYFEKYDSNDAVCRLRPVIKSGQRYIDCRYELKKMLDFLSIDFSIGNDAPKGGALGTYFDVKI